MMIVCHLVNSICTLYDDKIIIGDASAGKNRLGGQSARDFRAEMAKQNVTYSQLLEKLKSIGVEEDERNLRNKVSRGKFTAAFMLQCLTALGSVTLHLH